MENDNRLDLSLSLPCGGPSTGSNGNNNGGSEVRVEEADRGSKLIDDFKNFLDGSNHKEESTIGSQRSNQSKPEENLFYDLSKGPVNVEASGTFREVLEDRRHEGGSKRKNIFDEINNQKRHERDVYLAGLHGTSRTPPVIITTDEGSTAENDDVADSEAEGSTSRLNDKEIRVSDSSSVDLQSQRRFTISGQSVNVLNMPYSLLANESNLSQTLPVASGSNDRPGNQGNQQPLMFGYAPVQVASIEGGKSDGPHSLQYQTSYFGRVPPNTNMQNDGLKITQAPTPVNTTNPFERAKSDNKHTKEEGSSTHTEVDTKGTNVINQSKPEPFPPEYPSIKPGITADLKFGGNGSSPNLPWVSTTGPGPNFKTISGVTYKYSGTQIRIVCACHGSHMSPEEFVQHASEEQPPNPAGGGGSGLGTVPNNNPAASAQN